MTCAHQSNKQTHTYTDTHTHAETDKPIAIGEILKICLKVQLWSAYPTIIIFVHLPTQSLQANKLLRMGAATVIHSVRNVAMKETISPL